MKTNIYLEHSIIGSMLNDTTCQIIGLQKINRPEVFSDHVCQFAYKHIQDMFLSQKEIDAFSFKEHLTKNRLFPEIGESRFKDIIQHNLSITNFEQKLRSLKDSYIYRTQIEAANNILSRAADGSIPPAELAIEAISAIEQSLNVDKSETTKSVGSQLFKLQKEVKNPAERKKWVSTGYPELDAVVKLQGGDLVTIAARPSMGKTAFLLEILRRQSFLSDIPVCMFSLEMDSMRITKRLASRAMKVDSNIFNEDFKDREIENQFNSIVTKFSTAPLFIEDEAYVTVNSLFAKIIVLALTKKIKTFAIDHLGLIKLSQNKNQNKTDIIGDLTSGLKSLARKLDVTIIILSQLSRALESRPVPRPMLSDLRDSGTIEQDSDIVILLYRSDYYPHTKFEAKSNEKNLEEYNGKYVLRHYDQYGKLVLIDVSGKCEVIIAKNRDGKTGKLYFDFQKSYGAFRYDENISSLLK